MQVRANIVVTGITQYVVLMAIFALILAYDDDVFMLLQHTEDHTIVVVGWQTCLLGNMLGPHKLP